MMGGYGPGGPGTGYGPGYGMGPGMMGGYGYGPGGQGGYGPGYGMGPGMMGGYGMGPGMMGGGMMGGGMMGGGGMGPGFGRALWSLDLDTAQRKEVLKVQDELRRKNWEVAGKMQDEMAKLRDAYWASEKLDRSATLAAYKRINELRQQRLQNSLDAADKLEKILTAEQREQVRRWGPWWSDEVQ
jgi:Spy/CpxP family protein refolding chaperone